MSKRKASAQPLTTAQQIGSLIKSARDIMRKDKGLNGDLDRLPMLTWIMFLKFLDDMEQIREQEAAVGGQRFRPAVEPAYRWRDWAAREGGITGDELIAFVNGEKAIRPDGPTAPKVRVSSPTFGGCREATVGPGAMSSPRSSGAQSIA